MTYAVIHLPNFFLQAAVPPAMRRAPFAVLDGESPQEYVFAANKAARALGVELGMNRQQTECCGVRCLKRDRGRERLAEARIHEIACDFSPRIEHIEDKPGTYALDIRGMNTIFGNALQLATKLRQRTMASGYLVNVATAGNFYAAVSLASGRSGVTAVTPGQEEEALASLPLSVIPLTSPQAETFASWGIHTCGELAALKETDLIARMGQSGARIHALASGTWPHLMTPIEASFESAFVDRIELDFPVDDSEQLLFLLSRLMTTLLKRVCEKTRAIAAIRILLDLEGGAKHERTVRPALPLEDMRTLLKLIQLDLETHPPSASILALELRAQSAAPYRTQHGLFLPQSLEPGQTEVLLARLRKLVGEERVGSPVLLDEHRPDAFRMAPFRPPTPIRADGHARSTQVALRLYRPPQRIEVTLINRRPTKLYWAAAAYDVVETAGPVRLSGQWWKETHWTREEWNVHLVNNTTDCVCEIAYDPRSRCWYIQGVYD